MLDSHAHLDMPVFNSDREAVISRARQQGISTIITIGINLNSSRTALDLAMQHYDIFCSVGIHPHEAEATREGDLDRLVELAENERVIAIGEIGLDFFRNHSPRPRQIEIFSQQLERAAILGLPVIIHCRQAHRELMEILSPWAKSLGGRTNDGGSLGVIHCFSGDSELAHRYFELGFLISIPGTVTYPNAGDIAQVAREVPLDKMLVETDSPYLPPQPHRGQRNEPAYLPLAIEKIARLRGLEPASVGQATAENTFNLFRIPKIFQKGVPCH
ncbi:MAG: TatD family hydrolase [Dehalococcoidales bacterium]|jgi:TatD DNase family protein